MDLSKAFDTVNKTILLDKLNALRFDFNSNSLINDYMTNRYFTFGKDNINMFPLEHGVPQGSVLGPLLFLMYIQDMKYLCKNIKKIVYADDTTIIVMGR